jgi:hypothetical protein
VKRFDHLVKYFNAHDDCNVVQKYGTTDGHHLGNWVRDQRKKYKSRIFLSSPINMLTTLNFEFTMQRNVIGNKLTFSVAIYQTFKYKNMEVLNFQRNLPTNNSIFGLFTQRLKPIKLSKKGRLSAIHHASFEIIEQAWT